MAKRPRYSRWRRLPPVYRFGEHKGPDPNQDEQRLSLYLTGELLDQAEAQANRIGAGTIQDYCTDLLRRAIEAEQAREQVAELEARRGPLEGLHQIANDPEYLAEWSARAMPRDGSEAPPEESVRGEATTAPTVPVDFTQITVHVPLLHDFPVADIPSGASEVILRHAGQAGDDPSAFLTVLRRGETPSIASVSELAQALRALEDELRVHRSIDRRVAYALHRLSFEAQVLHTDAWPGAFDAWTVETLRAVQESVDRILSGQDIRYYPTSARPEASF